MKKIPGSTHKTDFKGTSALQYVMSYLLPSTILEQPSCKVSRSCVTTTDIPRRYTYMPERYCEHIMSIFHVITYLTLRIQRLNIKPIALLLDNPNLTDVTLTPQQ